MKAKKSKAKTQKKCRERSDPPWITQPFPDMREHVALPDSPDYYNRAK